jgi:hypothetical protein
MKRATLKSSDFIPAASAGNRDVAGKPIRSENLAPSNLTDNQEAALLSLFHQLGRKRKDGVS